MNNSFILIERSKKIFSPVGFFFLLVLVAVFLKFLLDEYIITDDVFYRSYAEKYTYEKIESLAETISTVEWIIYLLTPILYLLKFTIIASILLIGDVLLEYKIGFKKLFQIAMVAEVVFLMPDLIKVIWFLVFEEAETIKQVGSFEILSIYSFFKDGEIYQWLRYPFSIANLFELAYWFLLALGVKYVKVFDFNKSLRFILSTYVVALVLWVLFVVFISIM